MIIKNRPSEVIPQFLKTKQTNVNKQTQTSVFFFSPTEEEERRRRKKEYQNKQTNKQNQD